MIQTFFVVLFWFQIPVLLENEAFETDAREAVQYLYNQKFGLSADKLEPWKQAHPTHPLWSFWDALEQWWKILPDLEDTSTDATFFATLNKTVRRCDEILRRNPLHLDALILKSLSHGFMARQYSNRDNWYRSLQHTRHAMNTVFELHKAYPELPDVQFGYGLYEYYSALLREDYVWLRPMMWFLPPGDRPEGLRRLQIAADSSVFMGPESMYFQLHILMSYEDDSDGSDMVLEKLMEQFPDNIYYRRLWIRSSFWAWRRAETLLRVEATRRDFGDEDFRPADNEEIWAIRGRVLFRNNDMEAAAEVFEQVLRLHSQLQGGWERYYQSFAGYYLALVYEGAGRRAEAEYLLRSVAGQGVQKQYATMAKKRLTNY